MDLQPGAVSFGKEATTGDLLQLIRAEYLEIPGLCLTKTQVQRLWGLDALTCEALLAALVDVQFLRCTRHAAYMRY
jgi:hypothetical protein